MTQHLGPRDDVMCGNMMSTRSSMDTCSTALSTVQKYCILTQFRSLCHRSAPTLDIPKTKAGCFNFQMLCYDVCMLLCYVIYICILIRSPRVGWLASCVISIGPMGVYTSNTTQFAGALGEVFFFFFFPAPLPDIRDVHVPILGHTTYVRHAKRESTTAAREAPTPGGLGEERKVVSEIALWAHIHIYFLARHGFE